MEHQVKIDVEMIRALRTGKAWSQEHLASAAGISLRTVQRVEAEGVASAETRLALAGALGIDVAELVLEPSSIRRLPLGAKVGMVCGFGGYSVGGVCSVTAIYLSGASGAEAGIAYGVIGTLLGLTGAILGLVTNRYLKPFGL